MFEVTNQLLTRHSLYLAPRKNVNAFSFWNVNEGGFFLLLRCLYDKQNNTGLLRDAESLLSRSVRCANSWDIELKTRREIQNLRAPMYLFILYLQVQWIVTILGLNWAEWFGGRKVKICHRPCNWNTGHFTSWKEREWLWNVRKWKRSTFRCVRFIVSSFFVFLSLF